MDISQGRIDERETIAKMGLGGKYSENSFPISPPCPAGQLSASSRYRHSLIVTHLTFSKQRKRSTIVNHRPSKR